MLYNVIKPNENDDDEDDDGDLPEEFKKKEGIVKKPQKMSTESYI